MNVNYVVYTVYFLFFFELMVYRNLNRVLNLVLNIPAADVSSVTPAVSK